MLACLFDYFQAENNNTVYHDVQLQSMPSGMEIHKENSRSGEVEMERMRSTTSLELRSATSAGEGEKESGGPDRNSSHLTNYYQSLRNNVITLLENVRLPQGQHCSSSGVGGGFHPSHHHQQYGSQQTPSAGVYPPPYYNYPPPSDGTPIPFNERLPAENFDSYLTKLQTLCSSNNNNGPLIPHHTPHHDIIHHNHPMNKSLHYES